jgi:hypothetical protein
MDLIKEGWETQDWLKGAKAKAAIQMSTMGVAGDLKKMWDRDKPEEVEDAKRSFDYLVKEKKYLAFKVTGEDGKKGEAMREFDPDAGRMIMCPPVQGG